MTPVNPVLLDIVLCLVGLTPYDRATLESSFHWTFDKNNCEKRTQVLVQRGMSKVEASRIVNTGCNTRKLFGETEEFEYWVCPCKILHPQFGALLSAAGCYKNGILPHSGGLFEQNAVVMAGMELLLHLLAEREEKEAKAAERRKASGRQQRKH